MPKRPKVKGDDLQGANIFLLGSTPTDKPEPQAEEQSAQTTDELQQSKELTRQDSIVPEPVQAEKPGGINTAAAEASGQVQPGQPVSVLAQQRIDTTNSPEQATIKAAAKSLQATVTMMTPDDRDVAELIRRTAKTPVAVAGTGEGTRWSEAGWWLVPVIAIFVLNSTLTGQ